MASVISSIDPAPQLSFIGFNQDHSCILMGLHGGYKIFQIESINKTRLLYASQVAGEVFVLSKLFKTALIAYVSSNAPRQLHLYHFGDRRNLTTTNYPNSILSVCNITLQTCWCLIRPRLGQLQVMVLCTEDSLHIVNLRNLELLCIVGEQSRNPNGICALSPSSENCWLAYPANEKSGDVVLFDAHPQRTRNHPDAQRQERTINAHDHALAALSFNAFGTRLATASGAGTVIRVFSIPDGQRIAEFSRGVARAVRISSLAFNSDSRFLAASSDTETVHVFKLDEPVEPAPEASGSATSSPTSASGGGLFSWASSTIKRLPLQLLPSQVSQVLARDRDFATARLRSPPYQRTHCGFVVLSNKLFLTVLTSNAELLIFSFDTRDGGICQEVHSEVLNTDLNEPIEGAEQTGRVSDRSGVPIASSTARAAGSQSTVSQSSALRPVSPAIAGQDDDDIHSVDDDSHQNLQTDLPPAQRP